MLDVNLLPVVKAELDRRRIEEEAQELSLSLSAFVQAAWPALKPEDAYMHNWHLDAICEHLDAVSRGEITRLQVWVPPVSMKTLLVSVMWPAWEWTHAPKTRYICASYSEPLAGIISGWSRTLITGDWYQARWGDRFELQTKSLLQFSNDRAGTRLSVSPEGKVTGLHGHRIIVDDPIKPDDAEATSKAVLESTNRWWDSTMSSRGIGNDFARVIVMQRLHENDLAGHLLEKEHYEVLCLPERYEVAHPFAYVRDPRSEGDLLWPEFRNEGTSNALAKDMLSHRVAGQMQQRPAATEGEILKRHWWRFYHPKLFLDVENRPRWPKFRSVVISVDTPLKDKETNDLVAIQAWGQVGADRYLLELRKGHMSAPQAKRAIVDMSRHVRKYHRCAHYVLIENAGYGIELIDELKREITGVQKITRGGDGDKILRAEYASSDLESGNCYLPGYREGSDEFSLPDERRCPADIVDFIDSCAMFPNARNDDDVDAWSQCMNWLRSRQTAPARTLSSFRSRVPAAR
jgi:predicted phage terminase large subunit-like protein